jgi:hypothetical protein
VPDLLEGLVGKLRLERLDEPGGRLPGRVGDDVELDGGRGGRHGRILPRTMPRPRQGEVGAAGCLGEKGLLG